MNAAAAELARAGGHVRFEDESLQAALLEDLRRRGVRFSVNSTGDVRYTQADSLDVMDAVTRIRLNGGAW